MVASANPCSDFGSTSCATWALVHPVEASNTQSAILASGRLTLMFSSLPLSLVGRVETSRAAPRTRTESGPDWLGVQWRFSSRIASMCAHAAPDQSAAREFRVALGGAELFCRDIG